METNRSRESFFQFNRLTIAGIGRFQFSDLMPHKLRYLFACLLFFSCLLSLQAQTLDQDTAAFEPVGKSSRLNIGIRAGGTLAGVFEPNDVLTRPNPRLEQLTGISGGLTIQWYAKPNFSLQFGAQYTEKGWQEIFLDQSGPEPEFTDSLFFEQRLNYVDVPIMAHGYVGNGNVRVYLEAGLFLSYLISHSSSQEQSITDEQVEYRFVEGRDNRFNVGIVAGAGFEVVTTIGMFQLGGRYSLGFTSVLDKNITPVPNPLLANAIPITLGYFIMIK